MDNQLLLGSLFHVLIHIWLVLNLISQVHMDLAVWAAIFSQSLGVSLKYLTGLLIVVLLQCVHWCPLEIGKWWWEFEADRLRSLLSMIWKRDLTKQQLWEECEDSVPQLLLRAVDRDPRIQKLYRYYIFSVNLEGKGSEFKTNWLSTNVWADRAFIHWVCISIQLVRKFHIWGGLVHFLQV